MWLATLIPKAGSPVAATASFQRRSVWVNGARALGPSRYLRSRPASASKAALSHPAASKARQMAFTQVPNVVLTPWPSLTGTEPEGVGACVCMSGTPLIYLLAPEASPPLHPSISVDARVYPRRGYRRRSPLFRPRAP